jgi:hypothetical protein
MKAALILTAAAYFITTIVVATKGSVDDWWRSELARRGVAHYYLDAKNRRQWDWNK